MVTSLLTVTLTTLSVPSLQWLRCGEDFTEQSELASVQELEILNIFRPRSGF